jgi:hypothetical protein
MGLVASLRQWVFPREFRIGSPVWPGDLAGALQAARAEIEILSSKEAPQGGEQERLMADIATRLWRMRRRMVSPDSDQPLEAMRPAFRDLQSMWDLLAQAGVEIVDHTGLQYRSGMALKVLAFQPAAGLPRETVIETIRPTILIKSHHVQMGEVVVGTPPTAQHTEEVLA